MRELRSEIEFDGTPEDVWDVLVDLPAYGEWNPFMREIEGEIRVGARLRARLVPIGERGFTMRPTVLVAELGRELRWLGRMVLPGIFDGEHVLEIQEAGPGRVRFLQHERFRGLLVPFLWKKLRDGGTAKGFAAMNEALAARVADRRAHRVP
jgi:hypothetical protein